MSHQARSSAKKSRPTWLKVLAVIVGLLLLVVLAAAIAVFTFGKRVADTYDSGVTVVEEAFPDEADRPQEQDTKAQTILLLGSDTRSAIDPDDVNAAQDSRSDVIMVLRIPADREQAFLVSFMRDSWVDIPGYGEAKLNAAMAYGGVPLTVQVIEGLIGSRIDHVAMVDFAGFKGLTNTLGGVQVQNANEFSTGDFHFPAGTIELDGTEALAYVRARYPFADGDYQRVRNQQAYLRGLVSSLVSRGTLTSPGKIQDAVAAISPYLTVDPGMDSGYLLKLLPSMRSIRTADLEFFTAPTAGTGTSADGQSIVVLDEERMAKLKQAFETDTLAEYVETQDLSAN